MFQSKLESGGKLVSSKPGAAIDTIAEGLGLWRDTPFADLPDEDALRAARTRLIELRLHAVEQRIPCSPPTTPSWATTSGPVNFSRAPSPMGVLAWIVWPYVWKWTRENFVESNRTTRLWQLQRMETDSDRIIAIMPKYLAEEIDFWLNSSAP